MPLSGLSATSEFAADARYRAPGRRAQQDRPAKAEAQTPSAAPDGSFDPDYYASRFKTDLSQFQAFDGSREPPDPAGAEDDQKLFDFFGNLSLLLLAARAGDIARAQAAADALEFGASQSPDEMAARTAAGEFAGNFRSTNPPAPNPYADTAEPEDGGAAYDTLTQYLGGDRGAV
jgi:hypothetical protein